MGQGMRGYEIDGSRLALEIKEQARTKAGVGRAVGRDGAYIQGLCSGKVTLAPEMLNPLCEFLDLDEDELLSRPRKVQDKEILAWMDRRSAQAGKASEERSFGDQPRKKCKACKGEGWVYK